MLDELRRNIQRRLDDLLGEADKLRRALTALGSDRATSEDVWTRKSSAHMTRAGMDD